MSDELRERVAKMFTASPTYWEYHAEDAKERCLNKADAAIALIRADTLEEAAKVADGNGAGLAANRIRALEERT